MWLRRLKARRSTRRSTTNIAPKISRWVGAQNMTDEVIDKYLTEGTLSVEEMRKSVRKSTLLLKIVPVLAGSAFKNKGIQPLLDAVVDYLPSRMCRRSKV